MPVFKEALSKAYSPEYGREINPGSEISVTTGATEGLLSSIMAFVEPGDEVILMEPVFDLYAGQVSDHFSLWLTGFLGMCISSS